MPFHQRTVEPARLHRPEAAGAGTAGAPLFRSLEQVSSHALVCLLEQLADLSRCAGDIFGELEGQAAALGRRTAALHRRLDALHAATARLDHRRVKIPVSNLDEESRWTVHYTAPWHQQENVFLPATRPPCVEDLHRQAKLNLKSVLRECDKLRRDGYRSSQYYSQGPTFASAGPPSEEYQDEDDETDQKGSISSLEEERHISIRRPKTPTSSDFPDLNSQTNWAQSLPLPTPEEKMRLHAQTVQADVVPINITASGTSQDGVGGHSVYAPEHCSTLGRLGGCRLAGQRSETRDSSCQTEEVKVVPPSMRRIRAQKGQGIAAQMSHFSGSSGNMSVLSDSAGIVFPSRLNTDAGFHSLPRSGARASIQFLEPRPGAPGPVQDLDGTFQNPGQLGGASRTGTLFRPKSQELRHFESENRASPACVVSPHGTYSTSVIPNATLSSSSEVIAIQTAQSLGQLDSRKTSSSSHTKVRSRDHLLPRHSVEGDRPSPGGTWSEGPSTIVSQAFDPHPPRAATLLALCDSAVSLNTPANQENGSQAMAYTCRRNPNFPAHPQDVDGKSEPSYSGGGGHGDGEPWEYSASGSGRASPLKPHVATPGCSTPGSNMSSCSLDHTCHREGARSLYSEDHDGYYAVHPDAGPGSLCSSNSSNGFGNPRHSVVNVFDGRAPKNQGDKSHSRNISLKKAKKPPLPPSRTDSLRRVPKKIGQANGQVLNESLIASLQHSLQLSLRGQGGLSPSQSPCSDLEEPWLPRSRSQSTVSGGSSLASATAPHGCAPGGVTPSQSDTSSVKSEYTDPWGYYIDYTGLQDDPASPGGGRAAGSGAPPGNGPGHHVPEGCRAAAPHLPGGSVKPKTTSPEKAHRVTSPSSGYSSQSNTPTALTPVPVFLKSMSPANGKGKPKPKVPERKSSLVSSLSISSSSTSLSSNTSTEGGGTVKRLDSAPASLPAAPSLPSPSSPCPADKSPFLPPPPPSADSPEGPLPPSPLFPPPPPEVLTPFCSPPNAGFPPPPTARSPLLDSPAPVLPPPPSLPPSAPPPAPPLDPKLMKDARPSFKKSSQPTSPQEACRPPGTTEEGGRPPLPLITAEALQTVQLRPVRRNSGTQGAPLSEPASQEKRTPPVPQYHLKPSALLKSRNSINEMESESQPASVTSPLPTPAKIMSQGHWDGAAERGRPSRSPGSAGEAEAGPGPGTAPLQRAPGPSPSKKPPPISKKPKLFLVVPPPQRDFTVEPAENVSGAVPSPTRGEANETGAAPAGSDETDSSGSSVLEGGAAGSTSPDRREANVPMVQPSASPAPRQEEPGTENSVDHGGHAEERCPALQDPGPRVPESDVAGSSPEVFDFLKEEGSDEVMTPSRPRTTEDLFAAIHRSKRKVLGRKDSEDDHTRNHSPSPPVTPTGAAPSLASPKQVGSIQRSVRKSSTSSDNFKALLLKKGSRSDTSARMSAAEMLKNTDPRFQRSRSEPAPDAPDSPSSCSPSKNRRAQEEWARNEGLMPRSLSFSGPRYGRSRTPPSAASSRYSLRNRIQSSPMTVISEGEGEATEPVDTRARRVLGAARGCSLDGLVGDDMDGGGLPCGPADGTTSAQGRGPSEECGGPLREAS
ncbi:NHS-like protein 1 isoform X3 [Myotis myotis]|uniref:NHS like 1 n=1 Tax=Myotis myotis TaxID=51298 RepID=A0A7J7WWH9_MYOMY|nr:NHS-like protein 1 isoform X3 [Myotis myotis]KAF6341747.1 NHS like 1 [Myotis myotis]